MPNAGAYILSDVTSATIEVVCEPCGRHGVFNTGRLIAKYGADFPLPSLTRRIAGQGGCQKADDLTGIDGCKVAFGKLAVLGEQRG